MSECQMDFRIETWEKLLNLQNTHKYDFTKVEISNQRVLKNDVDRTRSTELSGEEKEKLELLLTYYCNEENIHYKQGMNEVLAPFIMMTRQGMSLTIVYNFFKGFIQKILPNVFHDSTFRPLQNLFAIFRLLLRYHEPRLSTFFQTNGFSPELFATSWFLTAFSSKIISLKALFLLWEELLEADDPLHLIYIGLGFLEHFKSLLLSKQNSLVPQTISQISLENINDVNDIITIAKSIKSNTPFSINKKLQNYNIFNLDIVDSNIELLNKQFCLSVMPEEILIRAYPEVKFCECEGSKTCDLCKKRAPLTLIVIDIRTEKEHNQGVFPNSMLLDPEAYENIEVMMDFPDQFIEMRGLVHICLLGTKEFKASSFDLQEANLEEEQDIVQNMTENLLQAFLMKGFSYVSLVDGGFLKCHNLAISKGLEIENHSKGSCKICRNDSSPLRIIKRKVMDKVMQAFSMKDFLFDSNNNAEVRTFQCKIFDLEDFSLVENKITLHISENSFRFEVNEYDDLFDPKKLTKEFSFEKVIKIKISKKIKSLVKFYLDDRTHFCFIMNSLNDASIFLEIANKLWKQSREDDFSLQFIAMI